MTKAKTEILLERVYEVLILLGLVLILTGCSTFDPKSASGFCINTAAWNGSPSTVIGCNREKGTTGGGIAVKCGDFSVVCNDIEKGSLPAPKVTP